MRQGVEGRKEMRWTGKRLIKKSWSTEGRREIESYTGTAVIRNLLKTVNSIFN